MIELLRKTAGHWVLVLGVVLAATLSGCATGERYAEVTPETGNAFHVGEVISVKAISFSGEPIFPDHTERIGEDGNISLLYIGQVKAEGKTAAQLQKEIHDLYVPKYYNGLNITIYGDAKYFFVDGEVRAPNKYEYPGRLTVVTAISMAGGFTDFANKKSVQVTHAGETRKVNVVKAIDNPSQDVPIYPGDRINVKRRIF